MTIAEFPLLRELPHIAHETPAWIGRHWKSLSLAAAATVGGGYLLFAHDSNPQNPSLRPTTPASDKFNPLGAGLDTDISASETTTTTTIIKSTECIEVGGQKFKLIHVNTPNYIGSQQIPCSSEEVKVLPTSTPFPVSGLESDAPQSPYKNALDIVLNGGASNTDIENFNKLALENMAVKTWFKNGQEMIVPQVKGLTPRLNVSGNNSEDAKSRVEYFNDQGKRVAYLTNDGSVMWE